MECDLEPSSAEEESPVTRAAPASVPTAQPFPTHLPLLPTGTKGRAVGKYRTKATKRNGYTPHVVYWNGNRSRPACWTGNCTHRPTFGFPGAKQPTRCGAEACRDDGMVDLAHKMCETCGEHQPTFGFKGAKRPTRCNAEGCREDGMVNLANKMCETCGEHQPTFGFPGAKRPTRCGAEGCRDDGMVDLGHKMCACDNGFACYEDTDGNRRSLCYGCAIAEGTHPERVTGASYEACRFFCEMSRMAPETHGYVPHVHWNKVSGEWNGYQEVKGLVEGRKIRPDGFLPDPSGATKGTVYLFHGNRWHGYPPGHPKHGGEQVFRSARTGIERRVSNADLYAKTEADSQAYLAAGYTVVEMWEHDFKEVKKQNGLLKIKLVRRLLPYVF